MDAILLRSLLKSISDMDVNSAQSIDATDDEEMVKRALRYLIQSDEKPLDVHQELKSTEIATKHNENGNRNLKLTSMKQLVEIYTRAVVYAPPDSSELARAYANRSVALYNGGYYDECLLDIEHALKIGYPEKLKAKLYARKARCLYGLNKNRMSHEVKCAVAETRKWLVKMDDANKIRINNILNDLSTDLTTKKLFKKNDYDNVPRISGENRKIMQASTAVDIKYSKKNGRHVIATRDIDAGETLFVHRAYSSIIDPKFFLQYCWNCSRQVMAGVPCGQCVTVIYCNESCRDMAWREHHDVECRVIPAMLNVKMTDSDLMALRLTIKAYKECGTFEKLKEHLAQINAIKDPITRSFTGKFFNNTKFASVYTLLRRDTSFQFELAIKSALILYFLAVTTEIFHKKIANFEDLLINQSGILIGGLILRNVLTSQTSCSGLFLRDDNGNRIQRGTSLTPFLNMFGRSCDPMVHLYTRGDINILVAIQRIKKGEPIFMKHQAAFWEQSTTQRRDCIQKISKYCCECKACVNDWGPDALLSLPSHGMEYWPDDVEEQLRRHQQKYGGQYLWYTPDYTEMPSVIKTTAKMMNIYQRFIAHTTQETIMFKIRLISLHPSY